MMNKLFVFAALLLGLLSCSKECDDCNEDEDPAVMETLRYPDGMQGESLLFVEDTLYTVPEGKTLYIHICESLFDESGSREYFTSSMKDNDYTQTNVIIVPSGTIISNKGFLNGLLIESGVDVFFWHTEGEYEVPEGRTLYLTSFKANHLLINGEYLNAIPNIVFGEINSPLILPAGTTLEHWKDYIFTGYYR